MEVLVYNYARELLGYIPRLAFRRVEKRINKGVVLYPFWLTQVEVLAYNYALVLLGYMTRLVFRPVAEKKN